MAKFFVKHKETGKRYRCCIEPDNHYFVFAPKRHKYGYRYTKDQFEKKFEIIPDYQTDTEKWHNNIHKVLKKLHKSGLWQELIPVFENLLKLSYEEHQQLKMFGWGDKQQAINMFYQTHPWLFITDKNGTPIINYDYINELSDCKLKSMYFGKTWNNQIKAQIKEALNNQETYISPHIQVSYDVSFQYNADTQQAWYSEEYRNCGNGHYYLALDEKTAIFCEDD